MGGGTKKFLSNILNKLRPCSLAEVSVALKVKTD